MTQLSKHTLIYDQDCGFCQRSIDSLRKILGDRVDYRGRLEFEDGDFGISHQASDEAIQFVEVLESGAYRVQSAAGAIFRALSFKPAWGIWDWLYRNLPGFAWSSELVYKLVARNRSKISSCKL